jgi:hypothetical protein
VVEQEFRRSAAKGWICIWNLIGAVRGGLLEQLLTDNDHAAAGVAGRVEAEGVVPRFL